MAACAQVGPGHIGPSPKKDKEGKSIQMFYVLFKKNIKDTNIQTDFNVYLVSTTYTKKNSKDIWSEEEVAEEAQYEDLADPRPQPE